MNPKNTCHLEGGIIGECWTRWNPKQRGQVRFWLGVESETGAPEVLLCAIELQSAEELQRVQLDLWSGRSVKLEARAHRIDPAEKAFFESQPAVLFVAESCAFDALTAAAASEVRHNGLRHGARGKMAAAGDDTELALEATL